jgi:hypothetical protein
MNWLLGVKPPEDWATASRYTPTLTAMRTFVTVPPVRAAARRWTRCAPPRAPAFCPAHSGHLIPTAA